MFSVSYGEEGQLGYQNMGGSYDNVMPDVI